MQCFKVIQALKSKSSLFFFAISKIIVLGLKLLINKTIFKLLVLWIIVVRIYFDIYDWLRTIARKQSFYSTFSTIFSWIKMVAGKKIFFILLIYVAWKKQH